MIMQLSTVEYPFIRCHNRTLCVSHQCVVTLMAPAKLNYLARNIAAAAQLLITRDFGCPLSFDSALSQRIPSPLISPPNRTLSRGALKINAVSQLHLPILHPDELFMAEKL